MNKASGGDGIPAELFEILSTLKYTEHTNKFGKIQQWLKKLVFIPIPMNAMPKNVPTTAQLCSFHVLAR